MTIMAVHISGTNNIRRCNDQSEKQSTYTNMTINIICIIIFSLKNTWKDRNPK